MNLVKGLLALAVFMGLSAAGLWADDFTFTFSNPVAGDFATGTLEAVPSGLGDDGLLAISGTLDVTSSSSGNIALGTYSLLVTGPGQTYSPTGLFIVDDLIYPNEDAASGAGCPSYPMGGASYLTTCGLLFGQPGTGSESEINIWGDGGMDYSFYAGAGGGFQVTDGSGGSFTLTDPPRRDAERSSVPEPGTGLLLGVGVSFLGILGFWIRRRALLSI